MLRNHRQLDPAVLNALRQNLEQRFERLRLRPHRDDRTREAFGLLAARAAEHQPYETEQRERRGGQRDPLSKGRRSQRLSAKRSARGPGAEREPYSREDAEHHTKDLPPPGSVPLRLAFRPLVLVERRRNADDFFGELQGLSPVVGRRQRLGALCEGIHKGSLPSLTTRESS